MTTHTPGPWTQHGTWVSKDVNPQDGYTVTSCHHSPVPEDEQLANARLIAATPDLLAMLNVTVDTLEHAKGIIAKFVPAAQLGPSMEVIAAARAAIAKATS